MRAPDATTATTPWWQALPAGAPPGVLMPPVMTKARDGLYEGRPLSALEHVLGTAALLRTGVRLPFLDADPRWQAARGVTCAASAEAGEYPWACLYAGFVAVYGEAPGGRLYDAMFGAQAARTQVG